MKHKCLNMDYELLEAVLLKLCRELKWLCDIFVKLRQGSGKDRQGMAVKAKGLKA